MTSRWYKPKVGSVSEHRTVKSLVELGGEDARILDLVD
jgi:hypothetical protein